MKIFSALVFLFNVPYLILLIIFNDIFQYELRDVVYVISLVGLFLIVSLFSEYLIRLMLARRKFKKINFIENGIFLYVGLIVFLLIIISNLQKSYVVFTAGYLGTYLDNDYLINSATLLPFYIFFAFRIFLLTLNSKIHVSNFLNLTKVLFFLSLISFLFTGSRSLLVYFFMSAYYYLSLTKPNFKFVNIKLIFIIVLTLVFIGVMREGGENFNFDSLLIRPIVETHHTAKTLLDVVVSPDLISESPIRYIQSLVYLFPYSLVNAAGFEAPKLLASVYVEKIDPGWAAAGGGFGFSILSELYIFMGFLGFFIFPIVLNFAFVWINKLIARMEMNSSAYALSLSYYIFSLVRGEIVDAYRGIFVVTVMYFLGVVIASGKYGKK